MTRRAYVQTDFARIGGVAVYLVEHRGQDRYVVGQPVEIVFHEEDEVASSAVHEPTLRLSGDMARALLDALAAHFGGSSDVQTLRQDYLAERVRVDKMIDRLIGNGADRGGRS